MYEFVDGLLGAHSNNLIQAVQHFGEMLRFSTMCSNFLKVFKSYGRCNNSFIESIWLNTLLPFQQVD